MLHRPVLLICCLMVICVSAYAQTPPPIISPKSPILQTYRTPCESRRFFEFDFEHGDLEEVVCFYRRTAVPDLAKAYWNLKARDRRVVKNLIDGVKRRAPDVNLAPVRLFLAGAKIRYDLTDTQQDSLFLYIIREALIQWSPYWSIHVAELAADHYRRQISDDQIRDVVWAYLRVYGGRQSLSDLRECLIDGDESVQPTFSTDELEAEIRKIEKARDAVEEDRQLAEESSESAHEREQELMSMLSQVQRLASEPSQSIIRNLQD